MVISIYSASYAHHLIFFIFSKVKTSPAASRPRGIRDLPMPPVVDDPEPEEVHVPQKKPPLKKEDGPKFKRPKCVLFLVCITLVFPIVVPTWLANFGDMAVHHKHNGLKCLFTGRRTVTLLSFDNDLILEIKNQHHNKIQYCANKQVSYQTLYQI